MDIPHARTEDVRRDVCALEARHGELRERIAKVEGLLEGLHEAMTGCRDSGEAA